MDQRRDQINPGASGAYQAPGSSGQTGAAGDYPVSPAPVRSDYEDSGEAKKRTSADIEREIAHTRSEMSETIDAIEERFSPQYIKEQVKEQVKESAKGAGKNMIETIKENPVPAAIAGLSIGWLIMKGREESPQRRQDYYRTDYRPMYGPARYGDRGSYQPEYYPEAERYRSGAAYESGGSDRSVSDKAGEAAQHARERAAELGHEVQHRAEEFGHEVQHRAEQAVNSLERMMYENPLAVGAIAVGVGAAVGLLLPSTQKEDELMGETRDKLVNKVQSKASDTLEKAEHVAEKAVHEAKEELKSSAEKVKETVKDESKKQGLAEGQTGSESTSVSGSTGASRTGGSSI